VGDQEPLPLCWFGNSEFDLQPSTAEETRFRHSGWSRRRGLVYRALMRTHASQHRLQAFAYCGANLWAQKSLAGDDLRVVANLCHDRFCVPCQTTRARRLVAVTTELIKDRTPRFVTLTLRASRTPLADQLKRLYASFNALRRRVWWRSLVTGGAAFVEVKLGRGSGLWHPHLHVLVEGDYLDQRQLSREWHAVTGDSSIVDVRAIPDAQMRASYVCKYVTKPAPADVYLTPAALDEMVIALKGRKLVFCFGTWQGCMKEDDDDGGGEWAAVGSVHNICSRAHDGDPRGAPLVRSSRAQVPAPPRRFRLPRLDGAPVVAASTATRRPRPGRLFHVPRDRSLALQARGGSFRRGLLPLSLPVLARRRGLSDPPPVRWPGRAAAWLPASCLSGRLGPPPVSSAPAAAAGGTRPARPRARIPAPPGLPRGGLHAASQLPRPCSRPPARYPRS
jgi:hypothetical protein